MAASRPVNECNPEMRREQVQKRVTEIAHLAGESMNENQVGAGAFIAIVDSMPGNFSEMALGWNQTFDAPGLQCREHGKRGNDSGAAENTSPDEDCGSTHPSLASTFQ